MTSEPANPSCRGLQLRHTIAFRLTAGLVLGLSGLLLFSNLGHYALWDDETMVGLVAQGVLKTGDTSALLDHNLVAYEDGLLLHNFCDRSTPPLPAYLTAASFALLGRSATTARLPFAVCGWLAVALMLYWARKQDIRFASFALLGMALLGNVSLFLFCRQCRYYGLATLASVTVAYCYYHWDGKRWRLAALVFFSLVLLASNYMQFVALYVCFGVDYWLWGRKQRALSVSDWAWVLIPQLLVGGLIVGIWNPATTPNKANFLASSALDRLRYIVWFLRDLNLCEFGNVLLLVAAPLLWLRRRNVWLIRIPLLLTAYLISLALLCPFRGGVFSEVRYLCPTIPLWIVLGVLVLGELARLRPWLLVPAGLLFFGTNLLSVNWLIPFPYQAAGWLTPYPYAQIGPRSTLLLYASELLAPPPDPYTVAADWINANLQPGQSVWVAPGFADYPLMFRASKVLYAWQLSYPPKPPYEGFPEINFLGRQPPDFMIGFAGWGQTVRKVANDMQAAGVYYRELPPLNCFGRDAYRPELFRRTFKPITGFDPQTEGIYLFQRTAPEAK